MLTCTCNNDFIIALGNAPGTAALKKLDGSVKKNSAFVKKLVKEIFTYFRKTLKSYNVCLYIAHAD